MVSLMIVYEPLQGRPLTLARVEDRDVLLKAARTALSEMDRRADALAGVDDVLSIVQRGEADRLRRIFAMLLPEFDNHEKVC